MYKSDDVFNNENKFDNIGARKMCTFRLSIEESIYKKNKLLQAQVMLNRIEKRLPFSLIAGEGEISLVI
jgi:hypothetical protein